MEKDCVLTGTLIFTVKSTVITVVLNEIHIYEKEREKKWNNIFLHLMATEISYEILHFPLKTDSLR